MGSLSKFVKKIAKAAVAVTTGNSLAQVKNVSELLSGKKRIGSAIEDATAVYIDAHSEPLRVAAEVKVALDAAAVELTGKIAGDIARDLIADLLTLQRLAGDVSHAVGVVDGVKDFVLTQDIRALNPFNMLMSAEIARARDMLWKLAHDVPANVVESLPSAVARMAAGVKCIEVRAVPGNFSAPQFAIRIGNEAMTLGELIVFNRIPGGSPDDLFLWAHELYHVDQYRVMGLAGFAKKYIAGLIRNPSDPNPLEIDADIFACRFFPRGRPHYLPGNVCPIA